MPSTGCKYFYETVIENDSVAKEADVVIVRIFRFI